VRVIAGRRWLAALACAVALLGAGRAGAQPSYISYFGLAWNIPEVQDHVNLYWAVSWGWNEDEVLDELEDAKARGMRAIVHTEFALFDGAGPYANACPYAVAADAAARWDAFAQALAQRNLLDTVAAFYPVDEPDLCGVSAGDVLAALAIIRAHALTADKPVAAIFTCDVAAKFGGPYGSGGHAYGEALRAYDWVGVDCYGVDDIFSDPAWTTWHFDRDCFCFRLQAGPSYYDNLKAQLDLPRQRLILVPQGFVTAGSEGLPDDPQRFADHADADPAVILLAPFTWFDQPFFPGVRSQPALAAQWHRIGKAIAGANPPASHPALPPAIVPRLKVAASDVGRFSVFDLDCNATDTAACAIELDWQAPDDNAGVQVFVSQDDGPPKLVTCAPAVGYVDLAWIATDARYRFDLYQMAGCPLTVEAGATTIASLDVSLSALAGARVSVAVPALSAPALATLALGVMLAGIVALRRRWRGAGSPTDARALSLGHRLFLGLTRPRFRA
jgi:hypothetical protein